MTTLYTLRNKRTHKLLGVKLDINDAALPGTLQLFYTFVEESAHFLYVHLSAQFLKRALSRTIVYEGSWICPFWGTLNPEDYEIVEFEEKS